MNLCSYIAMKHFIPIINNNLKKVLKNNLFTFDKLINLIEKNYEYHNYIINILVQ
jgi:hypothetical protein